MDHLKHDKPTPIPRETYKRLPITREPRIDALTPRLRPGYARLEAIGFHGDYADDYE